MAPLAEKIKQIVHENLRDGHADLETLPNGKVSGHVITPDFEQLSYQERRIRLRQLLSSELMPEQLVNVSTLLTYTPEEWAVQLSD